MSTPTAAVLLSSGLDSTVLAAAEARERRVYPIYVSAGLAWEAQELAALARLLGEPVFSGRLEPLAHLSMAAEDLYGPEHWAVRGDPPAFDTPDEDVYLAGRNVLLLGKAAVHCAGHNVSRLAIGLLAGNPFPDATPAFFDAMSTALSLGLAHELEIATPLTTLHKSDVIALGARLGVPLELTLSCMRPDGGLHCGRCSKCRERRDAFIEAGVPDNTRYAVRPAR